MIKEDIEYMQLAIELADKGKGRVNPNPLVGAVIVKENKIIAKGWHAICGEAHAEINALKDAKESVEGATMYVSLEPCSHFGKTPPCVDAIIKNKIAKVIIGQKDPNILVAGHGIKILKDAGIEVECGVLEEELRYQNRVFLKYIQTSLPWVIMKSAMTLDGKIASHTGDSRWVSCKESREYTHEMRNELEAIMVGVDTVIIDNPELTCRLDKESRNPIRIVVDSTCRIPLNSKILDTSVAKTIIATTNRANAETINKIKEKQVDVLICKEKKGRVDLNNLMQKLGEQKIDGILLEGGGNLNYSALKEGIVDEIISFIAPKIIGGKNAQTPVSGKGIEKMKEAIQLRNIKTQMIGEDIIIKGLIKCLQE